MVSFELAEIRDLLIRALLPVTAGALVAADTAVVKNAVDRRDARKHAEPRLALASARTGFASNWSETSVEVRLDESDLAIVTDRTKRELEIAYIGAQEALERGKESSIEEDRGGAFIRSLRLLLALGPYENQASYIIGLVMYAALLFLLGVPSVVYLAVNLTRPERVDLSLRTPYASSASRV